MNELQIFNHPDFGEIRTVIIDGETWLVGKDVAKALGYKDTSDALKKHVDRVDKGVGDLPTPGGTQKVYFVNESGMYALTFSSKLPSAKAFTVNGTRESAITSATISGCAAMRSYRLA